MIEVFHCEQNTPEWLEARRGIPTASRFATVQASGRGGGESKTRREYMLKLAGEILTGECAESYSNANMERGHALEAEARDAYCFQTEADLEFVGFIRNGPKGCSPDAMRDANGLVEIKTAFPHILIDRLLRGDFPPEHRAQCQGALWVAEREWLDIVVYWPRLPLFIARAYRDEAYIAGLSAAVDEFNAELADTVERVRRYGAHSAAKSSVAAALAASVAA